MPGILTAATGFVVALTGLITGLSQFGVFDRKSEAPSQEVASTPAPTRAEPEEHTAAGVRPQADSTPPVGGAGSAPGAQGPAPTVQAPAPAARAPAPAAQAPSASRPSTPAPTAPPSTVAPSDTAGQGADDPLPDSIERSAPETTAARAPARAAILPAGSAVELITGPRVCAPAEGMRRVAARTAEPIRVGGTTALPKSSGAMLRVGRGPGDGTLVVRLDSLRTATTVLAVPRSETRVRRAATVGDGCLKAGTRLTVTLGAAIDLAGP
ncbi:MAG TPA: hypothetical protein VEB59_06770, partial [Gemmatimonadales bacterium]|nr:hypothetical protein [Gemmatimonadales bacterium]